MASARVVIHTLGKGAELAAQDLNHHDLYVVEKHVIALWTMRQDII
jgi:hypothetical protein